MRRAVAALIGSAAVVSGIWTAPVANAIPAEVRVCMVLDDYPNASGVIGILRALIDDEGYSPYDAGAVMGRAVRDVCPEYTSLVIRVVSQL
jgi:hypothetical protein